MSHGYVVPPDAVRPRSPRVVSVRALIVLGVLIGTVLVSAWSPPGARADTVAGSPTNGCVTGAHVAYAGSAVGIGKLQIRFKLTIEGVGAVNGQWRSSGGAIEAARGWVNYNSSAPAVFWASPTDGGPGAWMMDVTLQPGTSGTVHYTLWRPIQYAGMCYRVEQVSVTREAVVAANPPAPGGGGFTEPPGTPRPTLPPGVTPDPSGNWPSLPPGQCYGFQPPGGGEAPVIPCSTPQTPPAFDFQSKCESIEVDVGRIRYFDVEASESQSTETDTVSTSEYVIGLGTAVNNLWGSAPNGFTSHGFAMTGLGEFSMGSWVYTAAPSVNPMEWEWWTPFVFPDEGHTSPAVAGGQPASNGPAGILRYANGTDASGGYAGFSGSPTSSMGTFRLSQMHAGVGYSGQACVWILPVATDVPGAIEELPGEPPEPSGGIPTMPPDWPESPDPSEEGSEAPGPCANPGGETCEPQNVIICPPGTENIAACQIVTPQPSIPDAEASGNPIPGILDKLGEKAPFGAFAQAYEVVDGAVNSAAGPPPDFCTDWSLLSASAEFCVGDYSDEAASIRPILAAIVWLAGAVLLLGTVRSSAGGDE